jgi:hypothetical protein
MQVCTGCFNTCIAPGVLGPYLTDITDKKFRKAWRDICRDFDGKIGGHSTASALQLEWTTFRYNNSFTMDQNVQYFEALKSQMEMLGIKIDLGMMNVILINGILQSAAHTKIKAQADHQLLNKTDYETTKLELKVKYSQLVDTNEIKAFKGVQSDAATALKALVAKNARQQSDNKKKIAAAAALAATCAVTPVALAAAGGVGQKRMLKDPHEICEQCGKTGHNKLSCYKLLSCDFCGKKGHADWQCYEKKRKTQDDLGTSFAEGTPRPYRK